MCFQYFSGVLLLMAIIVSNGALFMPNTHFMQEITRLSFDNYLDAVDNGQPSASPHYLRVAKGQQAAVQLSANCILMTHRDYDTKLFNPLSRARFTVLPSTLSPNVPSQPKRRPYGVLYQVLHSNSSRTMVGISSIS